MQAYLYVCAFTFDDQFTIYILQFFTIAYTLKLKITQLVKADTQGAELQPKSAELSAHSQSHTVSLEMYQVFKIEHSRIRLNEPCVYHTLLKLGFVTLL